MKILSAKNVIWIYITPNFKLTYHATESREYQQHSLSKCQNVPVYSIMGYDVAKSTFSLILGKLCTIWQHRMEVSEDVPIYEVSALLGFKYGRLKVNQNYNRFLAITKRWERNWWQILCKTFRKYVKMITKSFEILNFSYRTFF